MLALVVAVVSVVWLILDADDGRREVGVLPFENLGGDPADQYLVDGLKLELVHTLGAIPELSVKNARGTFEGQEISAIADALEVDYVLTGTMQRSGDALKVVYLLERGSNGKTISSGEVTGPVDEVFKLQADLAVLAEQRRIAAEAKRDQVIQCNMRELIDRLIADPDMLPCEAAEQIAINRIASSFRSRGLCSENIFIGSMIAAPTVIRGFSEANGS